MTYVVTLNFRVEIERSLAMTVKSVEVYVSNCLVQHDEKEPFAKRYCLIIHQLQSWDQMNLVLKLLLNHVSCSNLCLCHPIIKCCCLLKKLHNVLPLNKVIVNDHGWDLLIRILNVCSSCLIHVANWRLCKSGKALQDDLFRHDDVHVELSRRVSDVIPKDSEKARSE